MFPEILHYHLLSYLIRALLTKYGHVIEKKCNSKSKCNWKSKKCNWKSKLALDEDPEYNKHYLKNQCYVVKTVKKIDLI